MGLVAFALCCSSLAPPLLLDGREGRSRGRAAHCPQMEAAAAVSTPARTRTHVGVRVGAGLELYPKRRSAQFERVGEEMFQIAPVRGWKAPQRAPMHDDERGIAAALVRVPELRAAH